MLTLMEMHILTLMTMTIFDHDENAFDTDADETAFDTDADANDLYTDADADENAFDTDADDDDGDNIWAEHGGEEGCSHLSPLQQT